jgi:hypothetical protein
MNYLQALAQEIRAEVAEDVIPHDETAELFLIYAGLLLAKGSAVTAEDVHNAWAVWMTSQNPEHESTRPFSDLDPEAQREDRPFVDAIIEVAHRLGL